MDAQMMARYGLAPPTAAPGARAPQPVRQVTANVGAGMAGVFPTVLDEKTLKIQVMVDSIRLKEPRAAAK